VTKAPAWHTLVAWDMLFNNLSAGLFMAAALAELTVPEIFTPVAKAAYPIALLLLIADLACLVLDLGDPWRFHHMMRVFKPTSPMSLGTWCLAVYSLPLTVAAVFSLLPAGAPAGEIVRKTALVLGFLPALGVAVYKGVLLSTTAQPGWRDARWLGGYLSNSSLKLGCTGMLLLAVLLGQERAGAMLQTALLLLLIINGIMQCVMVAEFRPTSSRLRGNKRFVTHAAASACAGTLIPLILLVLFANAIAVTIAVIFILAGSLATRFAILRLPHGMSVSERH
jgi:hypothetical protein